MHHFMYHLEQILPVNLIYTSLIIRYLDFRSINVCRAVYEN